MAPEHPAGDSERSRRLLFSPELAQRTLRPSQLARSEVRAATRTQRIPSPLSRRYQRAQMSRGALRVQTETVARAMAARRAVLGEAATGPPRLLVRAGAFPHPLADADPARYGTERFRRAHALLAAAGMPYLIAVTPRVSRRPLDPRSNDDRPLDDGELELLAQLRRDGVTFAAHGLHHRTRRRTARRRSELAGLRRQALTDHLDAMEAELAQAAIYPEVFVPPFDRFDWPQWDALASRFAVVAAGHDSLDTLGYHDGPLWRGKAVWMPTYAPFHGPAGPALDAIEALARDGAALWTGVALDWAAELDDGGDALERLATRAAGWSTPWEDFLAAVRASA